MTVSGDNNAIDWLALHLKVGSGIDLQQCNISEMFIAWCKMMRKLFKLPNRTHNYIVCGIVECISIKLDRQLAKFAHSMFNSRNLTVFNSLSAK